MSTLIKILIGVAVVVVVVSGLVMFFRGKIMGFFENLPGEEQVQAFLTFIK